MKPVVFIAWTVGNSSALMRVIAELNTIKSLPANTSLLLDGVPEMASDALLTHLDPGQVGKYLDLSNIEF